VSGADPYTNQRRSLEIFNKGRTPFSFVATVDRPWIRLSVSKGPVGRQAEITITIDWQQRPKQEWGGEITITGAGETVNVMVTVSRNVLVPRTSISGFLESDGVVAMEAEHCTAHRDAGQFRWIKIADYGRTLSGMKAVAPTDDQTYPRIEDAPCLEYRMYLLDTGTVHVSGVFAPTLNFIPGRGLRYAVSFDNETPRSETLVPADFIAQHDNMDWERSVADNARISTTTHTIKKAGYHTLKIRMVDAGVVLEKIVVDCGGLRPSYGGPPESYHRKTK
jgi:hypothetical protein